MKVGSSTEGGGACWRAEGLAGKLEGDVFANAVREGQAALSEGVRMVEAADEQRRRWVHLNREGNKYRRFAREAECSGASHIPPSLLLLC